MTMYDPQPQREQLESLYAALLNSPGATKDLRQGLLRLVTVGVALVSRIEELQSEVEELKGARR